MSKEKTNEELKLSLKELDHKEHNPLERPILKNMDVEFTVQNIKNHIAQLDHQLEAKVKEKETIDAFIEELASTKNEYEAHLEHPVVKALIKESEELVEIGKKQAEKAETEDKEEKKDDE